MQRCRCPILKQKLTLLRTAKPSRKQKSAILRGHKAPKWNRAGYMLNKEPCADDVYHIYQEHPETLFLTITRRACSMLNNMALEVLFCDVQPLNVVPSDPESNLDNYYEGRLVAEEPLHIPIFAGANVILAKVILAKGLNKQIGFVNGMGATVLSMVGNNVEVRTEQGPSPHGASLDIPGLQSALPIPARVCQHAAQSARCDIEAHYCVARRPQHAGCSICSPKSCGVR